MSFRISVVAGVRIVGLPKTSTTLAFKGQLLILRNVSTHVRAQTSVLSKRSEHYGAIM